VIIITDIINVLFEHYNQDTTSLDNENLAETIELFKDVRLMQNVVH